MKNGEFSSSLPKLDGSHRPHPLCLMHGSQAGGADEHALAAHLRVLQVWVLAGPVDGIIVAAEQLPFAAHLRALMAFGALSHEFNVNLISLRITQREKKCKSVVVFDPRIKKFIYVRTGVRISAGKGVRDDKMVFCA